MRRFVTATVILVAFSALAPATAQIVGKHDYGRVASHDPFLGNGYMAGPGLRRELRDIDRRIDQARRNGTISQRQARQMRHQAAGIYYLAGVYRHGGISRSERIELRARIDLLRDTVNRRGRTAENDRRGR